LWSQLQFLFDQTTAFNEDESSFFRSVTLQTQHYTGEITCHAMDDPLTQSNLSDCLDIIHKYGFKQYE